MHRIIFISFSGFILLFSCSIREKNPLVGLWIIHSIEQQDSTEQWVTADWMKGGNGYLHYDAVKNMSLHFTPARYDQLILPENDDKSAWDPGILAQLSSDYWYVGEYKILGNVVQHTRLMHSNPIENKKKVSRNYFISGDTLVISAPEFKLRLKWLPAN